MDPHNQLCKKYDTLSLNSPMEEPVRYLFPDTIALKVKRTLISRESLLCGVGIMERGKRVFLRFIPGGRESRRGREDFLLFLKMRGVENPCCITLMATLVFSGLLGVFIPV